MAMTAASRNPLRVPQFTSVHCWPCLEASLSDRGVAGVWECYRNPDKTEIEGSSTTQFSLSQHHNNHSYLGELVLYWKGRHQKGTHHLLQHWDQMLLAAVGNVASGILGNWLVLAGFHAEASWELRERSKRCTVVRMSYFNWSE